jgi:hypothetical protein
MPPCQSSRLICDMGIVKIIWLYHVHILLPFGTMLKTRHIGKMHLLHLIRLAGAVLTLCIPIVILIPYCAPVSPRVAAGRNPTAPPPLPLLPLRRQGARAGKACSAPVGTPRPLARGGRTHEFLLGPGCGPLVGGFGGDAWAQLGGGTTDDEVVVSPAGGGGMGEGVL